MGVWKEELYALEQIAQRQVRIYDDACDCGIPINDDQNPEDRETIRRILKTFIEAGLLVGPKTLWGRQPQCGAQWLCRIMWEPETGVDVFFGWHRDRKREFLTVDIRRAKLNNR